MAWSRLLEARFRGKEISPGRISSKDIAKVIAAIEDIVALMIIHRHSELDIRKDSIIVGLSDVAQGSLELGFDTNDYELSSTALSDIHRAFETSSLLDLPIDVRRGLDIIVDFNKEHDCFTEINHLSGKKNLVFTLTPESKIPYSSPITGETVIYGEITRVGGTDAPRVQFKTISGELVYCDSNKSIAKEAGKRLYTEVGLSGTAEWNPETMKIDGFRIQQILEYQQTSLSEAFGDISDDFSDAFPDIEDADSFLAEIRRD